MYPYIPNDRWKVCPIRRIIPVLINTFSPYFSRGWGYIKENESMFENISDTLAKSDRFGWLDMWSLDGCISKSRWISVTLFYLGNFLRKRWTVSRIDRSFQLSVLFNGQSWNSIHFIELNYLNWTRIPSYDHPYPFSRNLFYKHSSSSHLSNCRYALA